MLRHGVTFYTVMLRHGVTFYTNLTKKIISGNSLLLILAWLALSSCDVSGDANPSERHQHSDSDCVSLDLVIERRLTDGRVCVDTYYVEGFEFVVVADGLSVTPEGGFYIDGPMAWATWAMNRPSELLDRHMTRDQGMPRSRASRFAKVRVTGQLESNGEYGHMGEYEHLFSIKQFQIFDTETGVFISEQSEHDREVR